MSFKKQCLQNRDLFIDLKRNQVNYRTFPNSKRDYKDYASKIFGVAFKLILLDIIENNVIFVTPNKFGIHSEISVHTYKDEEFKNSRQKGKFKNVDFLESEFTGNEIRYNCYNKNKL